MSVARRRASASQQQRRLHFLHSPAESEETLTADRLSIYSNDSVKDLDGRFFEYFSSANQLGCGVASGYSIDVDSVDGQSAETSGRRPTLSEELLQRLTVMERDEQKELSNKQRELLYEELLYTIQHMIGADTQPSNSETSVVDLYSYGRKAFHFTDEQHNHILAITNRVKPPVLILNVVVEEARNLEAKDANGFSDPYCMLGIIPGSRLAELCLTNGEEVNAPTSSKDSKNKAKSMLRKFSGSLRDKIRAGPRDKPQHIIPAKFIRSTKFIPHNLNPVWNEKFKFDIEDVKADKIHIDVWDHDDEESVFDAAKSLNQAKTFKGLGRVFKQIAQSARASSGDNVDDFLGCIDIPLHDVPSTGFSSWYDLCGRSAKSKVQGQIKVSLSLATREDYGISIDDNFNDMQQHEDLLLLFIDYERQLFEGDPNDWPGILSAEADVILHQHSVQGDITPAQEAFSYWITFSKKYRECNFSASCLLNILKSLEEKWDAEGLAGEEEARLGKSFKQFLNYFLDIIEEVRGTYPADNSDSMRHLEALLECVQFLITSKVYAHCCPLAEQMSVEIGHRLKNGSRSFFMKTISAICQPEEKKIKDKVQEMMSLTNALMADIKQGLKSYHPLFYDIMHVPYFDPAYRVLERKLSSEVRRLLDEELSSVLLSSELSTIQEQRRLSNHSVGRQLSESPKTHARDLLISSVLNLYFCIQKFADFRERLIVNDGQSLAISRYQDWFSRTVQEWLTLSKAKLEARIDLAVQQDKFINIEDSFECSTSAMDVVSCYTQIAQFWQRLRWENDEELFAFSLKLADDICQSAVLYTDTLHSKMKKNSYFDDEGQFDVHKPLCTCINDLEYIRMALIGLPDRLNLHQVISAIERRHSMDVGQGQQTHFHSVFQSLIDSALSTMDAKIVTISQRVTNMMRPDIKKNVFHLCWSPEKKPVVEAVDPLIDYLDSNLLTLYTYLLRRNFKTILSAIWQECLEELQEVTEENDQLDAMFCNRLLEALDILADFFNADNKGLLKVEMESQLYQGMRAYLTIQKLSTFEIICQFFKDMISLQRDTLERGDKKLGTIEFKTHYDKNSHQLHVEVCHCNNIIALDSNGLSDPYIVWDLCPRHIFNQCAEEKTSIKKKTLNPVYDEKFHCQVSMEDMQKEGACLRFTLMDYNFVVKNDFGGEAYFPLREVPQVERNSSRRRRGIELAFMKPHTTSENRNLLALSSRVNDAIAQEFVNNREDLAGQAQHKIEAFEAMSSVPAHRTLSIKRLVHGSSSDSP